MKDTQQWPENGNEETRSTPAASGRGTLRLPGTNVDAAFAHLTIFKNEKQIGNLLKAQSS